MRFFDLAGRIWKRLVTVTGYMSGGATLLLMVVIVYDVVLRYFFNRPTAWSVDLSEILLVYITFLAAAWILSVDGHIRVDLLLRTLKPRDCALTNIVTSLIGLLYGLFLVWLSWEQAWDAYERELRFSGYPFPQFPVLVIVPIGTGLLCIQWTVNIAEYIRALAGGRADRWSPQGEEGKHGF